MKTNLRFLSSFGLTLVAVATSVARGQPAPLSSIDIATPVDSGWTENTGSNPAVLWSTRVEVPDAVWVRLRFADVRLGRGDTNGDSAAFLRITSVLDGHVQTMHARHVAQWRRTSAYFNGDAVDIEIVASPNSGPCRVQVESTTAGTLAGSARNICDLVDDRLPSMDPRSARIVPVGCTGWLINDPNYCQLTAGHCVVAGNADVVEFNVPPSTDSGAIVHPAPSDQYAIDLDSLQFTPGIVEVGEDWAYYGVFENSTTGMTAYEAQGDRFALAADVPAPTGQILRKTGFGTTGAGVPPSYNQAQKTLTGPFTNEIGTWLHYPIDSSGGDSGSPVFLDGTDIAYAVHTNGGCAQTGYNSGTSIENADLQFALANPKGVCIPNYFEFGFPDGMPQFVNSAGGTTMRVTINARNLYEVAVNSGVLHYNAGDGWLTTPIQVIEPGEWTVTFPAMPCARNVNYYLSFETTSGASSTAPPTAPNTTFSALSGSSLTVIAAFDFQTSAGWFVSSQDLISGAWGLGTPFGAGEFGEPVADFDGSGQCYLTGPVVAGDDVDGGPTRLWSPGINMSGLENPIIQYARWFTNSNLDEDRLVVELANNSVVTFDEVESVSDSAGWTLRNVLVNDHFASPGMIRIRFSATDNPNNSRTEAAIDAVMFLDVACIADCLKGDVNLDGRVDGRDIEPFVAAVQTPPPVASDAFCATDMDDDGDLTLNGDVAPFVACMLSGACP